MNPKNIRRLSMPAPIPPLPPVKATALVKAFGFGEVSLVQAIDMFMSFLEDKANALKTQPNLVAVVEALEADASITRPDEADIKKMEKAVKEDAANELRSGLEKIRRRSSSAKRARALATIDGIFTGPARPLAPVATRRPRPRTGHGK